MAAQRKKARRNPSAATRCGAMGQTMTLLPKPVKSLGISDPDALVSMLEKGNDLFVAIVNRDITVRVKGNAGLRMVNKAGEIIKVIEEQILSSGDIIILFAKNNV
jgi:hypothetical protein